MCRSKLRHVTSGHFRSLLGLRTACSGRIRLQRTEIPTRPERSSWQRGEAPPAYIPGGTVERPVAYTQDRIVVGGHPGRRRKGGDIKNRHCAAAAAVSFLRQHLPMSVMHALMVINKPTSWSHQPKDCLLLHLSIREHMTYTTGHDAMKNRPLLCELLL